MKLSAPSISFALLATGALADYLPACSFDSATPCACPSGTQYAESVTFGVIGAAPADVKDLISDFFNCGWLGVVPFATQGPDNRPGVSLVEFRTDRSGSFIQVFESLPSTLPLEYHSGNGSFGGWWVTLQSTAVFKYETAIRWSVYACSTGFPLDFAQYHENQIVNATNVLQAQGKIRGKNVAPVSIQSF